MAYYDGVATDQDGNVFITGVSGGILAGPGGPLWKPTVSSGQVIHSVPD